jgi:SpoVK/Ycf46/Vps4 family AAA+-type ATPase
MEEEFGGLVERLEPSTVWDELALSDETLQQLHDISTLAAGGSRLDEGRGGSAMVLFTGTPGTGKTMAAEALAGELHLDLWRIDLSQVVSKYIGETEKNLHRLLDAAEPGGAVLFFDEADALFGRRTEPKDSHDRYANKVATSLLQRFGRYRGLVILAADDRGSVDDGLAQRCQSVVRFGSRSAT